VDISTEWKILAILLPLSITTLLLQWMLSQRVATIIKLRDDLYIIPSSRTNGDVNYQRLRRSLQLHLESQWAKRHLARGLEKF